MTFNEDEQSRADLAESIAVLQTAINEVVREAQTPLREDLPGVCDITTVVAARVEYWRPLAEDQGRAVSVRLPSIPIRVGVRALEMGDVVDICLDNIFAHTGEGVGFAIMLALRADRIELEISDAGPGFTEAPGQLRRGSSGMGLTFARRIVERAHGRLSLSPAGRSGGRVLIELPPLRG